MVFVILQPLTYTTVRGKVTTKREIKFSYITQNVNPLTISSHALMKFTLGKSCFHSARRTSVPGEMRVTSIERATHGIMGNVGQCY